MTALARRIADEIRVRGPIPFERFMDLALYDPREGYYARGPAGLGPAGDFVTASDSGTAFGDCLARQAVDLDERLGRPDPFTYLEVGAGRGLLARDVADALAREAPDLRARLRIVLADQSAGMREAAGRAVPGAEVLPPTGVPGGLVGLAVAVELFDALPVRRVRRRGGRLVEVLVGLSPEGGLVEVEGEPEEGTATLAKAYGAAPEEGDEGEVSPRLPAALAALAGPLARGLVVIVDYGYPAPVLYAPAHNRGTLLAYRRHAAHEDLLADPGRQDLTAHVNLTQLEDEARALGLAVAGTLTQERFLLALGILDRFRDDDPATWGRPDRVRARLQASALLHPGGLGHRFQVVLLSRGLPSFPPLRALTEPWSRA